MKVMMKKYSFIATAALMLFAGCDDFLSKVPDNRASIKTKEEIAALLVTAYPDANYMPFCEAMSDNVEDNQSQSLDPRNTDPYYWRDVNSVAQDSPENYWNSCYSAIAAANHALEAIDKSADPTQFNDERGEALVCRAYAHFMLVSLFARVYHPLMSATDPGIPYVTSPETKSLQTYDRGTVASVYANIEKDLMEGLPLINDDAYETPDADATGVPSYHFTRAATLAFASRFYLFKQDYDKVIEYATQVFTGADFAPNLRPWNSRYSGYSRTELETNYTRATEKANLLLVETLSDWASVYGARRYSTGLNRMRELTYPNVTYGDYAFSTVYTSQQTYFIPKFHVHFVKDGPNANTGWTYTVIPLFTAEEVLLNRAEAYAAKEELQKSLDDLNVLVAQRVVNYVEQNNKLTYNRLYNFYGESINQKAVMRAVLDLRRVEFVHEGMRWFDILRHHLPVEHWFREEASIFLTPYDNRRVLQIPQEAINMGGLQPNPR